MPILADNKLIALNRMLFVDKQSFTRDEIDIEASGPYALTENDQCFIIQNKDCCRPIMVTVKTKDI